MTIEQDLFVEEGSIELKGNETLSLYHIKTVTGSIIVSGNADLIMRDLVEVHGNIRISGNASVSFPNLSTVRGYLRVSGNGDIVAEKLGHVGEGVSITGNADAKLHSNLKHTIPNKESNAIDIDNSKIISNKIVESKIISNEVVEDVTVSSPKYSKNDIMLIDDRFYKITKVNIRDHKYKLKSLDKPKSVIVLDEESLLNKKINNT